MTTTKPDYKKSLNLPKTDFPMKANLAQNEPASLLRWEQMKLYERVIAARQEAGAEKFIFHDGPPYANGDIHVGHLLNKVLKDFVVRSKLMAGRLCPYVPGWDCHGLPIEHRVMTGLIETGKAAKLDILRKGRPLSVTVNLAEPPRGGSDDVRNLSGRHPFDGARVSNILPGIADELRLAEDEGVVVLSVRSGSVAARLGLRAGDTILQVGRSRISSVLDLDRAVQNPQRVWQLAIKRGGRVLRLQVQVPG